MGDASFAAVRDWKAPLLLKAAKRLCTDDRFQFLRVELHKFRRENVWVEESALFYALTQQSDLADKAWWTWPEPLRLRCTWHLCINRRWLGRTHCQLTPKWSSLTSTRDPSTSAAYATSAMMANGDSLIVAAFSKACICAPSCERSPKPMLTHRILVILRKPA